MKKLKYFPILLLLGNLSYAQTPNIQWQKSLGGSLEDRGGIIKTTSDGGYIVVGGSNSTNGDVIGNHGAKDAWIVKLNSTGAIQWQKALGGSGNDIANYIQLTSDGGYIVAGQSNSTNGDVTGNHGDYDYWIVKLSSTGIIQWQKSLGGSAWDNAWSIEPTSDGGYIIAGDSYSTDGDVTGNHGIGDYWIVKLNSTGAIQWQKSLGGSGYDFATSIQQTPDGGYIVAGSSDSNNGDVTGNHGGNGDYWIVKLNSAGAIQWQKTLGGSNNEIAGDIHPTSDGGYIVAGGSYSTDGDITGNHGSGDVWIVKLNSIGAIQWQKSLGGSNYEKANSIQPTSGGGYIVAGVSNSTNGDVTENHGDSDYWIVKLNSNGTMQWQKTLGGNGIDYGNAILQNLDNSYIIAGQSSSTDGDIIGNHGSYDYWIVKLNPENLATQESVAKNKIFVENPVKNMLNIESKENILALQLFSTDGKLIRSSNNKNMQVSDLPKGNYLLNIRQQNGKTVSEKIIKE